MAIRPKQSESFERALAAFKKRCKRRGILKELQKDSYLEKPSERKKRKRSAAKRRLRKLKLKPKRERKQED